MIVCPVPGTDNALPKRTTALGIAVVLRFRHDMNDAGLNVDNPINGNGCAGVFRGFDDQVLRQRGIGDLDRQLDMRGSNGASPLLLDVHERDVDAA